jgi:hypothetical protein
VSKIPTEDHSLRNEYGWIDDDQRRVLKEAYEEMKPAVLAYLFEHAKPLKSPKYWRSCYGFKQRITPVTGYFFSKDMYYYCIEAGFSTRVSRNGTYEVRAKFKKRKSANE